LASEDEVIWRKVVETSTAALFEELPPKSRLAAELPEARARLEQLKKSVGMVSLDLPQFAPDEVIWRTLQDVRAELLFGELSPRMRLAAEARVPR
jgi:hypothetical protein